MNHRRLLRLVPGLVLLLAACASPTAPGPDAPADGEARRAAWLAAFARGWFPGRSGQVFVVTREGQFITTRDTSSAFMHGSPWDCDARLPLLLHGPRQVLPGGHAGPARQQDVAPTLGALLGLPRLATYTGRVLSEALRPFAPAPRVVLLVVADGLRADALDEHADVLPTLARLRHEGAWFPDARTDVLPTVTATGHANIGTGSEPRLHGIAVNGLWERASGRAQEVYDGQGPHELLALTLADQWNLFTGGRAVILGLGGAMRATAGLVGHGGCLVGAQPVAVAAWSGAGDGGWETYEECYRLPDVLRTFVARDAWEAAGGVWRGRPIRDVKDFRATALYQAFEGEALLAVLRDSEVGADGLTDLVLVNFKGPDYTAHRFGPRSTELRETLAELDRQLARVLELLEQRAGPGGLLLVLTSDHGMPDEPPPGGRHWADEVVALVEARFGRPGAPAVLLFEPANGQVYVDTTRLAQHGATLADVARFLESLPFVEAAFTEDEVAAAQARLPAP
jgi:hypothetical protein